jgi:pro-sigmaK processing inhibitor BofA
MFKQIFNIFRKIIFSILALYMYNLIGQSLGIIIPINIITILILTILGLPALFSLIFILVFVY